MGPRHCTWACASGHEALPTALPHVHRRVSRSSAGSPGAYPPPSANPPLIDSPATVTAGFSCFPVGELVIPSPSAEESPALGMALRTEEAHPATARSDLRSG